MEPVDAAGVLSRNSLALLRSEVNFMASSTAYLFIGSLMRLQRNNELINYGTFT